MLLFKVFSFECKVFIRLLSNQILNVVDKLIFCLIILKHLFDLHCLQHSQWSHSRVLPFELFLFLFYHQMVVVFSCVLYYFKVKLTVICYVQFLDQLGWIKSRIIRFNSSLILFLDAREIKLFVINYLTTSHPPLDIPLQVSQHYKNLRFILSPNCKEKFPLQVLGQLSKVHKRFLLLLN